MTTRRAAGPATIPSTWMPLLDGALAARAVDTALAIADALRAPPPQTDGEGAFLVGGSAGHALLFSYLARTKLADGADIAADGFLNHAIGAVADVTMPPSLFVGFTGIAWAVSHLADRNAAADDSTDEIDDALRTFLSQSPWMDDYDLIIGLAGIGVYALERLPHPNARNLLALVIDRLEDAAEHVGNEARWLTSPELLPSWQRALCPKGYYNLGVAHGIPGVIVVLAGACAAGVGGIKARRLLDDAVRWLLLQAKAIDERKTFPSWIAVGGEPFPSRHAWCYGDPGIAAALLVAARAVGESSWEREALDIARRAARCPMADSGVRDAGICHGAAGLAHIFNRFYQATHDDTFAQAAHDWFVTTLDMRQPDTGIAGYRTAEREVDGVVRWIDDAGLLSGAAGIALTLLGAVSDLEPEWDRLLLLSLPPLTS
jgi:lantibiotic biosynthesis protein